MGIHAVEGVNPSGVSHLTNKTMFEFINRLLSDDAEERFLERRKAIDEIASRKIITDEIYRIREKAKRAAKAGDEVGMHLARVQMGQLNNKIEAAAAQEQ